jgi:hypothetical protein
MQTLFFHSLGNSTACFQKYPEYSNHNVAYQAWYSVSFRVIYVDEQKEAVK